MSEDVMKIHVDRTVSMKTLGTARHLACLQALTGEHMVDR